MKAIISKIVFSTNSANRYKLEVPLIEGMTPVMAIAGPNGSGKSRLLRCIKEAIEAPKRARALTHEMEEKFLQKVEQESYTREPGFIPEMVADNERAVAFLEAELDGLKTQMDELPKISMAPADGVLVLDLKTRRPDMRKVADATMFELSTAASRRGLENFDEAMLDAKRRVVQLSLDYIAATSNAVERGRADARASARFESLSLLVERLLRVALKHVIGNTVTLFGQPLDGANLSDGQALLLQFAAALVDVKEIDPCVVLLDEPETHLHPAAQIALLDVLKEALPNGQIIMATHSVPLLAHIGVDNIWSMSEGRLSKSGKDVQSVLANLMGGVDDIARMRDFIDEPARIAAVEFAKQCLVEPLPAPYEKDDPQQEQMVSGLGDLWPSERPLRVLDWGAGKGRLAAALREHLLADAEHARSGLEYFAYNPFCIESDREACMRSMSLLHAATVEERFLADPDAVAVAFARDKVDAVVLCNCLHEIEPKLWPEVFTRIATCLSDDGVLVIVEDLEIRIGELAFPQGFFLLDEKGMAALLGVDEGKFETSFPPEERYKGRLVRYAVPKGLLGGVRQESVRAAIARTQISALENIQALREEGLGEEALPEWKSRLRGRRHALFAQQVANAILFLDDRSEDIPAIEGYTQ